jgi:hypothetical protein
MLDVRGVFNFNAQNHAKLSMLRQWRDDVINRAAIIRVGPSHSHALASYTIDRFRAVSVSLAERAVFVKFLHRFRVSCRVGFVAHNAILSDR